MALTSPRFAGNQRLQSAALNSPAMCWGERGQAVAIVQQAYVDLGHAMPNSTVATGTMDGIFGKETYSVTRHFQSRHGLGVDGIVGKQTLAKLDALLPGPKPVPPVPPKPAPNPRFEAAKPLNGFDHTVTPRWQMVPINGSKIVRLMDGDGLTVTSNSPAVTVHEIPKCFVHGGREFELRGHLKGKAMIEARNATTVVTRLEAEVKSKKTVKLSFSFVQDNAGHKTTRSPADVDGWVKNANDIMFNQANIELKKHNVRPIHKIESDLGTVVIWSADAAKNEWKKVVANRDGTADLNVFLVWEYEQDATENIDNAAAGTLRSEGNCLLEDNIGYQTHETLSHEIGHYLGMGHSTTGGDLLMSPSRTANRISKAHAAVMNP